MAEINNLSSAFQEDVEKVGSIEAVRSILEVICRTTGMGFAAIARVTEDRWIACAVRDEIEFGLLPGSELKIETTICDEIRQSGTAVVINNVEEDPAYCWHHTPAMYGFKSYISVPIFLKDGTFFGTLCAIDPKPATLNTPHILATFDLFADLIAFHLNAIDEFTLTKSKLLKEQRTSKLRDQFIAILGHDLRNPVAAISSAAQVLRRMPLDASSLKFVDIIKDSSSRIKGLIDNILDFARGKLGEGIIVNWDSNPSLEKVLDQVIEELYAALPGCYIEKQYNINKPVYCDSIRIAQLFSNLLSNALTHGKKDVPVKVKAFTNDNEFILSVSNYGKKIPENVMNNLFQPFARGDKEPRQQGLGLGLYIASEIARAHEGSLKVKSTDEETSFTLTIPSEATYDGRFS